MTLPVDECPAGYMMDAAVAKCQGWHLSDDGLEWLGADGSWRRHAETVRVGSYRVNLRWRPSKDIHDADVLIDKGIEKGGYPNGFQIGNTWWSFSGPVSGWGVCFDTGGYGKETFATAETRPLAICRAFLKLHGVMEIEVSEEE